MQVLHRLNRFRSLSGGERGILLAALGALPLIQLLLHLFGFNRTTAVLGRVRHGTRTTGSSDWTQARRIAHLSHIAARRGVTRGNCLSQSLTLWWLLQHAGIEGELRIGVRKQQDELLAHAWVELLGMPLNERR